MYNPGQCVSETVFRLRNFVDASVRWPCAVRASVTGPPKCAELYSKRTRNEGSPSTITRQMMPLGPPRPLGAVAGFSAARGRVWPRAARQEERPRPPATNRARRRRPDARVRGAVPAPLARPSRPSKSGGKAVANTKGAARRAPRRAVAPLPPSQGRPGHYITSAAPDAGRRAPAEHKNGGPAPTAAPRSKEEAAPVHAAGDGRGRPDPV